MKKTISCDLSHYICVKFEHELQEFFWPQEHRRCFSDVRLHLYLHCMIYQFDVQRLDG